MPPGIGYSTQDLDQEALQRSFQTPKPKQPLSDPGAAGLDPWQAGVMTNAPDRDPWAMGVMSPGGPVQPLSGGGPMPPSPPPADPIPPPAPPPPLPPLSDPSWQPPGGDWNWHQGTVPPNPGQIEEPPMALSDPRWRPDWNGGRSLLLQRLFGGL